MQNWNVLGNISDKRYSKLWRQSIESLRSASLERVSEKSQLDLGRTIETRLHKIAEFHNNSLEIRGMTISPQPRIQKGLGQKSMHSSFSSLQDALYPLKDFEIKLIINKIKFTETAHSLLNFLTLRIEIII